MNKWTKLLSVFMIAGAVSAGAGAIAGCTKKDDHTHSYTKEYVQDGENGHYGKCECGEQETTVQPHKDEGTKDGKCDDCGYVVEYSVTYKLLGNGTDKIEWTTNKVATKPADPKAEGYEFKGWFTEDGSATDNWGEEFTFGTALTENAIVYAKWAESYKITFNMHGHGTQEALYTSDGVITPPADPTENGYDFVGWYEKDGSTTGDWGEVVDLTATFTENTDVHAYWLKQAKVSFNLHGHGEAIAELTTSKGLITEPADPEAEGVDFMGWYEKDGSSTGDWGKKVDLTEIIKDDTEVHAYWLAPVQVTFNLHDHGEALEAATTSRGKVSEPVEPVAEGYVFEGWYEDEAYQTAYNFGTVLTEAKTLHAKWSQAPADEATVHYIYNAQQLIEFRKGGETLSGTYKLYKDIDLRGYALEASTAVISAGVVFDGQGYTISNGVYNDAAAKSGLLCQTITGNGKVTNVKFLNCAVNSSNEAVAIVAGECNGVEAEISKIEFNSCAVATTANYVGLVFARTEGSNYTINVSEITAKNGCTTSCAQYGGLLVGDMTGTTAVTFKNLDIAGEFKGSSGNGSFIAGRTRSGATVTVENAIINAVMPVKNSIGIFSGNDDCSKLTIKNVLIVGSNVAQLYQANKAPKAEDITNLYAVEGVTVDQAQAGTYTAAFAKDTLGFDFTADTGIWMEEGGSFRLRASSTNVKSANATITQIKVNPANAKTRFKKGETFTAEGLAVTGVYSDGVQLVLEEGKDYKVIYNKVNMGAKGVYTVTVASKEDFGIAATYTVTVAEETGFKIYDEFMTKVYVLNAAALDVGNLVVRSTWSDGIEEDIKNYTVDAASYNLAQAGKYNVAVKYGEYATQEIAIQVVGATPDAVSGNYTVKVDAASSAEGTFANVKDAIDYLEASNLPAEAKKIVRIAAGTYEAKITTSLDNLVLVGEGERDKVVLTYSAVESTVDIVSGKQYGLACATLHVNGKGFMATNLTIRNDFNYIRDNKKESSPQGLALTINGDGAVLDNVHLYGNQDTLYFKSGRTYIKGGLVEGNIDFIFGEANGLAYFEGTEIKAINKSTVQEKNNGYVTAMKATEADKPDYGYIFDGCHLTDDGTIGAGSMSLGRPWGAKATVAYINCDMSAAYSTLAYDGTAKSRWFEMSGNSPAGADFCEYGTTGAGAITEAADGFGGKVLTSEQAANYTKANIFAKTNGKCTWDAAWDCDAAYAELVKLATPATQIVDITIKNSDGTDNSVVKYASGDTPSAEVLERFVKVPEGKEFKGFYTDAACTTAYTPAAVTEATTIYAKFADKAPETGVTYTYTHGGENAEVWTTTATQKVTSADATPVQAEKLVPGTYLELAATGKKATLNLRGFTTGSSKASAYVSVEFVDASGNVLTTLTGTTGIDKKDANITFENNVYESATDFVKIRITSKTDGKSVGITSASIKVE